MTFETANFKELGGAGNKDSGGQAYSVFSTVDTLATMMASGYLNAKAATLNANDLVLLVATDGSQLVRISSAAGATVIDVSSGSSIIDGLLILAGAPQALSGAGAIDILSATTEFTSTGAAQALTLADGAIGQRKTIIHVVDGGSGVLTPANALGFTTITFAGAGEACEFEFRSGGWAVIGRAGTTDPVIA